jgi:hypothetical protein
MALTTLKSGFFTLTDKLGDAFIYALDEARFWTEVVGEFFELDESASDRHLQEMRQTIREQIG